MNETKCEFVRDRLPEYASGVLEGSARHQVQRHLEKCPECASELRLVELIGAGRPEPPAGLLQRVQRASALRPDRGRRPWMLPLAAALALALGTGLVWRMASVPGAPPVDFAAAEALPSLWPSGDGAVAGDPLLDELSDEALLQLLSELEG